MRGAHRRGQEPDKPRVGRVLREAGLRVALIRHPMPYHDLEAIRVQRFATIADIDRSNPTIEEREEYERVVAAGLVMYAGVDYAAILEGGRGRGGRRSSGTAATTTSRSSAPTC